LDSDTTGSGWDERPLLGVENNEILRVEEVEGPLEVAVDGVVELLLLLLRLSEIVRLGSVEDIESVGRTDASFSDDDD
jgi:hypothetical protein